MFQRKVLLSLVGAALMVLTASSGRAAGGDGPEAMSMGGMCMVTFGNDMIHIIAYQPGKSREEYCEQFPATGPTVMVFDLETPRFRDLPIDVRIIRDPLVPVQADTNLDPLTEIHIPAQKYGSGTFNFEHDFKKSGDYIGIVTLTKENGQQESAQFRFSVGDSLWLYVPYILGALFIGMVGFAYWRHSHPALKAQA